MIETILVDFWKAAKEAVQNRIYDAAGEERGSKLICLGKTEDFLKWISKFETQKMFGSTSAFALLCCVDYIGWLLLLLYCVDFIIGQALRYALR